MRRYGADELRNVALVGHGGAGKTTLGDAALWCAGAASRPGRVDEQSSAFDYEPEEHKHRGSLSATTGWVEWRRRKINLIDTPGHGNFLVDTRLALEVADAAVVVVSAADGVQVQTERTWAMLGECGLPRCVLVGKMDRERADFAQVLDGVRRTLSDKAVAAQLPLGVGDGFVGLVDLVRMKALRFEDEGRKVVEDELPESLREEARAAREQLVEAVATTDDTLLARFLDDGVLSDEELSAGFTRAVRDRALVPVLVGAPARFLGVQPLLDLIVGAFPSPAERAPWKGNLPPSDLPPEKEPGEDEPIGAAAVRAPDPEGPVAAYVWKTITTDVGHLSLLRVLSGRLASNSNLLSVGRGKSEHIGQLYALQGRTREPVSDAAPGELVAVAKLKHTHTGDTLCDDKAPFVARRQRVPQPLLTYALRPRHQADEDKLAQRLAELLETDLALRLTHDAESHELLLGGTGQIHVEVAVERLQRAGVEVELLPPRVPYLETARGVARHVEGKHKKQTGGKGQYGVVYVDLLPLPRGAGFEFEDAVVGGAVPRQFIPAVEKGIRERMRRGVLAGYPAADVKVRLLDGKFHDVDSDARSFEIAGSKAFQAAFRQANPCLLEPMVHLAVVCTEEHLGEVIGDLNHRRGRIEGMESNGRGQVVRALVPLAETLRYASELRALTGGHGSFTATLSHYEELPAHLAEKVLARAGAPHPLDEED